MVTLEMILPGRAPPQIFHLKNHKTIILESEGLRRDIYAIISIYVYPASVHYYNYRTIHPSCPQIIHLKSIRFINFMTLYP